MISGIMVVGLFVLWFLSVVWLCVEGEKYIGKVSFVIAFFVFVIPLGAVIGLTEDKDEKYPCVHYETRMQYNPATKTVMPLKVCVERGEWVNELE